MKISKEDIKCVRRLTGELESSQDKSMFELNLLIDDSLKDCYQDYKLFWECYPKPSLPLKNKEFPKQLWEDIAEEPKRKIVFLNTKHKILAAVAAVLLISFCLYLFNTDPFLKYTNHITVLNGQRKHINLPDGSTVTINSNSEIKYSDDFSNGNRSVWFKGEAYFDIVKDPDRPFKVMANGFLIQVLGTKFNVNTKGEIKTVSLESGKVQVTLKKSGDIICLSPKEELSWNTETGEVAKRNFDVSKTIAWKDNILLLDDVTLTEALVPINAFYGTEFIITNSVVANKKIRGAFENQDLPLFIETLEFIADVKITPLSPKKLLISPRDEK